MKRSALLRLLLACLLVVLGGAGCGVASSKAGLPAPVTWGNGTGIGGAPPMNGADLHPPQIPTPLPKPSETPTPSPTEGAQR